MTPQQMSERTHALCRLAPVVPVIVVEDVAHAVPLARALVTGNLPVLEVTLRTPAALDVIRAMAEVEGGHVGAGTLLTPADVKAAKAAGATFGVAPGATEALLAACEEEELPLLPGAATASEVMALLERGYSMMKFFPAEAAGGVRMLQSLYGPLPQARFCPTGGITPANLASYLALPNVICCGGSWVAPAQAMQAGEWSAIEAMARGVSAAARSAAI